jgi:hypothetical protein
MAVGQLIALGPMSQAELVYLLSITSVTGVQLVDRMERDGLGGSRDRSER